MNTPTIEQIESYSCQTYGVTMEEVNEKGTRQKNPVAARRMIFYLLVERALIPYSDIQERYKTTRQRVFNGWFDINYARKDDVELNSVITEFENKLK